MSEPPNVKKKKIHFLFPSPTPRMITLRLNHVLINAKTQGLARSLASLQLLQPIQTVLFPQLVNLSSVSCIQVQGDSHPTLPRVQLRVYIPLLSVLGVGRGQRDLKKKKKNSQASDYLPEFSVFLPVPHLSPLAVVFLLTSDAYSPVWVLGTGLSPLEEHHCTVSAAYKRFSLQPNMGARY